MEMTVFLLGMLAGLALALIAAAGVYGGELHVRREEEQTEMLLAMRARPENVLHKRYVLFRVRQETW